MQEKSSVVCVSVLGTQVSCAETDEPIGMQFGARLTWAQGTVYLGGLDPARKVAV